MNIADLFFKSFCCAANEEIKKTLASPLLTRHAERKSVGSVMDRIISESTLRYIALRKLYEHPDASGIKFVTEKDRIDLILIEGKRQVAFELKCWQSTKELRSILVNDYNKLVKFLQEANCSGYSLIFTINDGQKAEQYYRGVFKEDVGKTYKLKRIWTRQYNSITVCVYLASPKQ